MNVSEVVDRKVVIRLAHPHTYARQRLGEAGAELSRAGELAARVEVANEAICKLISVLYEVDADSCPANIDRRTGRILVPVPWGNSGWAAWGIRNHEARILRAILLKRSAQGGTESKAIPLFLYCEISHSWALNIFDYPTAAAALDHARRHPVSLKAWRSYAEKAAAERAERRRKSTTQTRTIDRTG
jgi:hypothetical protein